VLSLRSRERGDQRCRLVAFFLRAICSERLFRRGHISQEAITLDDAPDHAVKIGLLVFAQKIGEIGQIVVGAFTRSLKRA
jgi:hypothetical protein